ncbi:MAG: ATP-dependent Clp protease ATP-binding subunit, partial [Clostridia bacterium]|nr:ATP-dependent Clp protease ATP-binding subunit [Clostridia bacterium]
MKKMICSKCKQRPAVIFIQRVENGQSTPEGLCLKCAMEMNLGPIKQMMESMGITEDDVDAVTEQMDAAMQGLDEGSFENGGAPSLPFMQNIFGNTDSSPEVEDAEEGDIPEGSEEKKGIFGKKKKKPEKNKRKYLSLYCTDLTAKARNGKIDRIIGRDNEISRAIQILCRRT